MNPIPHSLVDFTPNCLRRLRRHLMTELKTLAWQFCETEEKMIHALNTNQVLIGILDSFRGKRCVFLEYNGIQVVAPVHERH